MDKPWLLPDGVEEILPAQASKIEIFRRQILDLYRTWGYQLVIPPLLEHSETLLPGLGKDMLAQTMQFGDPMSARLLAIRADITPQIVRIDAHSLARNGCNKVNRLCYVGTAVKSRLVQGETSRTPIYIGAELYGDDSQLADVEVIMLMLESLQCVGLSDLHLGVGHVGVYRELVSAAGLSVAQQDVLFDALQRKAQVDIDQSLQSLDIDSDLRECLSALAGLHGDESMLDTAKTVLSKAPAAVIVAIEDLQRIARRLKARAPNVTLYFDLSELRAYHYHSGLVFSALVPGLGRALAKGGRYNQVGEVFGRARAATGFHIDLKLLTSIIDTPAPLSQLVVALETDDDSCWQAIQQLRQQGNIIVCTREEEAYQSAEHRLIKINGNWQIES